MEIDIPTSALYFFPVLFLQGPAGQIVSVVQLAVTISAVLAASFFFNWRLTLVMLGLVPILVIICYAQFVALSRYDEAAQGKLKLANMLAVEAMENIHTVAQLTSEDSILEKYHNLTEEPYKAATVRSCLFGVLDGLLHAMLFFASAVAFRFGVWEIEEFLDVSSSDVLV